MKIKRFFASDMRTAFALVRQEQGPDAVILSNRMTEEGVEIVAAANYDETLVQRTLEAVRPAQARHHGTPPRDGRESPPLSPAAAAAAYFDRTGTVSLMEAHPRVASVTPPSPTVLRPAANVALPTGDRMELAAPAPSWRSPASSDPLDDGHVTPVAVALPPATRIAAVPQPSAEEAQLQQMRTDLAAMRSLMEHQMHRLTDERLRGSPVRAQTMDLMDDYGFDAGITRDITLQIPPNTELHRGRGLMLGLLSQRLPILTQDPLEQGGVIALIGPTGAGKTTTIAKLAATYASRHNPRDVALVTTDTLRVGGCEQLHRYGRQFGIAVHEADSDAHLAQTLDRLSDYTLVLIDTAGMGQRDRNLVGQLNGLCAAGQVHCLLVLPANSHFADLDEVVRRFSGAHPHGVVLTKVDETGRLGSALSVIVDHDLPMVWITDGQQVPGDLHRANASHLVLRLDQLRREADRPSPLENIHVA